MKTKKQKTGAERKAEIVSKLYRKYKEKEYSKELIFEAMDIFAEEQSDLIYDLFNKPTIELKPLEDLWRKENPRDKFTIPDRTAFYKWIRLKILPVKKNKKIKTDNHYDLIYTTTEGSSICQRIRFLDAALFVINKDERYIKDNNIKICLMKNGQHTGECLISENETNEAIEMTKDYFQYIRDSEWVNEESLWKVLRKNINNKNKKKCLEEES